MKRLNRAKGWYKMKREKRLKKNNIEFKRFIKQFRIESLQILQNLHWHTLKDYQKICRDFTELTINNESIDVSGRHGHGIHIDHIMPLRYGWVNKISPYLLGMSCNLQRLYWKDNFEKRNKYNLLTE